MAGGNPITATHRLIRLPAGCLLLFPLFVLFSPAFAAEASDCLPDALRDLPVPGTVVSVAINGGETHCYRLPEDRGDRLAVIVRQRGVVDVRLGLEGGKAIDSPLHYAGDEMWFSAADKRTGVLRVTSKAPRGINDSYGIVAEWLEPQEVPLAARYGRLVSGMAEEGADDAALAAELLALSGEWRAWRRPRWAGMAAHLGGALWQRAGRSGLAGEAFIRAGERYTAAGNFIGVGQVLNHRAMQAVDLARFDDAAALLAQALDVQRLHDDRPGIAATLNNQGLLQHYQGHLDEARSHYLEAAALNEALGHPHERLAQLNNLGGIHFVRGEAAEAAQVFREVISSAEKQGNVIAQAAGLGNLGLIQMNAGAYLDALATYAGLLEIYRETSIDALGEARTLDRIGQVYVALGDPLRGIDYLEQGRARRVALDDRRGLAQSYRHLANARLRTGNLAAAHAAIEQGLALKSSPADAGNLQILLGRVLMRQGNLVRAAAAFTGAARQLESAGEGPQSAVAQLYAAEATIRNGGTIDEDGVRDLLAILRDGGFTAGEIHLYYVLALNAFRQGRLAAALAELDAAESVIERVRNAIPLPELRASYAGSRSQVLDLRVAVLMALHFREPEAGHARRALMASDASRARGLLELLQSQDVQPSGQAAALSRERRTLLQQINFRVSQTGVSFAANDALLASWRARLDVLDTELAKVAPLFAALVQPGTTNVLPELRRMLGPNGALVQYHVGRDGSYAWVVTEKALFVRKLAPAEIINERLQRARQVFEQRAVPAARRNEAMRALAETVLDPVADVLLPYSQLFIVADGALHLAPFAALPDANGNPLVVQHTLRMLPSMGAGLQIVRHRAPDAPPAVALVGDPVYDATDARLPEPDSIRKARMIPAGRLRGTGRELQAVAGTLPAAELHVFSGFEARAELVRDPVLANADIVHFAVHGLFDSEAPALSGLLLSRFDSRGHASNGFVGLRDIYGLDWNAALVVLSGCETARGRQLDGVGVIGMTSGFLAAGVAQTVASLWRIPDTATAEFMRHFYSALEHLDAGEALREAQLAMRADRRWRHPYYWSGFVVYGFLQPGGMTGPAATVVEQDPPDGR